MRPKATIYSSQDTLTMSDHCYLPLITSIIYRLSFNNCTLPSDGDFFHAAAAASLNGRMQG